MASAVVDSAVVASVDLGASGGRVLAVGVSPDGVSLREVSRFGNEPVRAGGTLYTDILRLYQNVVTGLASARESFGAASAGIDSWGCDYGLLDSAGTLIGNPVHYRDGRTDGVTVPVSGAELYAVTGIQHLPFNTIYQVASASGTPALTAASTLLLIPDLLAYWLTGSAGAEVTNASTTGLLDVSSRTWATGLMERLGIPPGLFPPPRQPGSLIGPVRDLPGEMPLIAVGSHDTASAVAAVPAGGSAFAYISSGTWSLAGMELPSPVLTEESRRANFTNESGIDGTVRYLRNVTGLWLLQECLRTWGAGEVPPPAAPPAPSAPPALPAPSVPPASSEPPVLALPVSSVSSVPSVPPPSAVGTALSLDALLAAAAAVEPLRFVIDADDPVFLPPGDMPSRIVSWLTSRGLPAPSSPAEVVRCILDSLALAYRRAVSGAQRLSGRHADVVHIVGGGARNALLCQLTADACGLPVLAGPAEATALGNALVQARALGAAPASLDGMRALLRASVPPRPYSPSAAATRAWSAAARRTGLS